MFEAAQPGAAQQGVAPKKGLLAKFAWFSLLYEKALAFLLGTNRKVSEDTNGNDDQPDNLFSALGRPPEGEVIDDRLDPITRIFFWAFSITCISFIIWMNVGTLDIVSMTQGEVIPSSQLKTIQHLEGGIVRAISVKEGQAVKKGQPLVELERTGSDADVSELSVRLNSLAVDIVRLQAEAEGKTAPVYSDEMKSKFPNLVKQALTRSSGRRKAYEAKIASHKQLIQQRKSEINEISARLSSRRSSLKLLKEQLAMSKGLLESKLTTRYEHLALMQRSSELGGEIQSDQAALNRSKAALAEARAQTENNRESYQDEAREALDASRLEFRELSQRLRKFEDSLTRTVLRSPVDGLVKTLYVATIGGVVKAGDIVVDIVPGDDRLIIEAKLPTQDIGFIQPGQTAVVKLTSADAARYGSLDGTVVSVSPDTILSPEGAPYYKVRVETDQSFFQRGKWKYQLYPGMQLMANIRTGERTVFQYLFDPLIAGMGDSMQER